MVVYCDWCRKVPVSMLGQVCSPKCQQEIEAARRNHRERPAQERAQAEAREAEAQLREAQRMKANAEARLAETEAAARRVEAAENVRLAQQAAQTEERRRQEAHYVTIGADGRKALAQKAKSDMDRVAIVAIFDILGDADSLIDQMERLPKMDTLSDQALKQTAEKMTALRPKLIDKRTEMGAIQYWAAGKDRKAVLGAYQAALDRMDQWVNAIHAQLEQRVAARKAAGQAAAQLLRDYNGILQYRAKHLFAKSAVAELTYQLKLEEMNCKAEEDWLENDTKYLNGMSFFERMVTKSNVYKNYSQNRIPKQKTIIERQKQIYEQAKQDLRNAEVEFEKIQASLTDVPLIQEEKRILEQTQESILSALALGHLPNDQRLAVLGAILGGPCGAGTWTPWGPTHMPEHYMSKARAGRFFIEQTPKVTLTRSFTLGTFVVPQVLWEVVMGTQPSWSKGELRPVDQISWYDAVHFCNALSERLGLSPAYQIRGEKRFEVIWDPESTGFRLPTEAEWGWAGYRYNEHHPADNGWQEESRSVGLTKPNLWGFYDMYGNVNEWCWDIDGALPKKESTDPSGPSQGNKRVVKGNGINKEHKPERWALEPKEKMLSGTSLYRMGFRIAQTL